jgi:hypothetical protein
MQLADERTPASHLTWARNKSTTEPVEPKKLSEAEAAAMASQNAGAGSTWNSSQTWEEKEITKWSKQLLREELLPTLTLSLPSEGAALPALPASHEALTAAATAGSLSAELRVTAVEKVDGEATHIISRGKRSALPHCAAHHTDAGTRTHTRTRTHAHTHAHVHRRLLSERLVRARQLQLQLELREGDELREILSGTMTVAEVTNDELQQVRNGPTPTLP